MLGPALLLLYYMVVLPIGLPLNLLELGAKGMGGVLDLGTKIFKKASRSTAKDVIIDFMAAVIVFSLFHFARSCCGIAYFNSGCFSACV